VGEQVLPGSAAMPRWPLHVLHQLSGHVHHAPLTWVFWMLSTLSRRSPLNSSRSMRRRSLSAVRTLLACPSSSSLVLARSRMS
jgi:hypothetical protein